MNTAEKQQPAASVHAMAVALITHLSEADLAELAAAKVQSANAHMLTALLDHERERRRADRAEALLRHCVGDGYFAKMQQQPGKRGGLWGDVEVMCQIANNWDGWLLDPEGSPLRHRLARMIAEAEAQRAKAASLSRAEVSP